MPKTGKKEITYLDLADVHFQFSILAKEDEVEFSPQTEIVLFLVAD